MSQLVTVRNTYVAEIDFGQALTAVTAIDSANTVAACGQHLAELGECIGLPTFLLLYLGGAKAQLRRISHNVPGAVDADLILGHPQVAELLERSLPVVIDGCGPALGPAELTFAVAVVVPRSAMRCVMVFGRPACALSPALVPHQLGLATMAAQHLVDVLPSMSEFDCPLSARELECLCLTAAGSPARETARRLGISHRTVELYNARCRLRLGVETTLAAAVSAIRQGWLTHDQIEACQLLITSPQSEALQATQR